LVKLTIAAIEGVSQTVPQSSPRSEPSGRNVSLMLLITTFVTLVWPFKQLRRLIYPAQIVFVPRQFTNLVMLNWFGTLVDQTWLNAAKPVCLWDEGRLVSNCFRLRVHPHQFFAKLKQMTQFHRW
jgi:hypothetical protein